MKMKRVTSLLMAAALVLGSASLADAAVEFKASGHMHLNFGVKDNGENTGFNKDEAEDNFYAAQRFRPKLTMKAEGVTAVFEAQQYQAYWGSDWPVGGNPNISGTDDGNSGSVRIRQAYIDFKLPNTPISLKVGYQDLILPSIWGHPVLEDRVGAVVATIPFNDQVALSAFYARPANDVSGGDTAHNSFDMFGALLPLDFDTVKATPYLVYGRVSDMYVSDISGAAGAADKNDDLIVGGVNLEILPSEALSIKVDAIVTNLSSDTDDNDVGTGFMLAAAVDYALPWGTPGVFAWYATGYDDDGEGALLNVSTEGFGPSSWGFAGGNTFDYDAQISDSGVGTWAIGLQLADLSFVDSLTHTVRVLYAQGTNDKDFAPLPGSDMVYWTDKDSFIEVDLDSAWSIYENLEAVVELGGLIPDLSTKTKARGYEDDFAWKAQLTLRFSF